MKDIRIKNENDMLPFPFKTSITKTKQDFEIITFSYEYNEL